VWTSTDLFRASVLWWAASSCRHRWFKPWAAASSCRHRWLNPSSCRYRGASSGFDFLLVSIPGAAASSSRYRGVNPADKIPYRGVNPADKIPPRVVIVVSTPPRVVIVVPAPPRVAIVVSIQRIRSLIVRGATKLLSLLWYKPGVRLPPRVANVVQTPGETLAGKWVDVSISIW